MLMRNTARIGRKDVHIITYYPGVENGKHVHHKGSAEFSDGTFYQFKITANADGSPKIRFAWSALAGPPLRWFESRPRADLIRAAIAAYS